MVFVILVIVSSSGVNFVEANWQK